MLPGVPGEQCRPVGHPNASLHSSRSIRRQFPSCWPVRPSHNELSKHVIYDWSSQGLGPHVPLTQLAPPQFVPQFLQFCGSVLRSVHVPEQFVVPGGQLHAPLMQAAPAAQAVPQLPQLPGSVARLRQIPLQHVPPGPQASPQLPQFCGSDASVLQVPPQLV